MFLMFNLAHELLEHSFFSIIHIGLFPVIYSSLQQWATNENPLWTSRRLARRLPPLISLYWENVFSMGPLWNLILPVLLSSRFCTKTVVKRIRFRQTKFNIRFSEVLWFSWSSPRWCSVLFIITNYILKSILEYFPPYIRSGEQSSTILQEINYVQLYKA